MYFASGADYAIPLFDQLDTENQKYLVDAFSKRHESSSCVDQAFTNPETREFFFSQRCSVVECIQKHFNKKLNEHQILLDKLLADQAKAKKT